MGSVITLLRRSSQSFRLDNCATLAAAIAYHAVFALFPLALLGVSLLGFFVGDEAARRQVVSGIAGAVVLSDQGEEALAGTLADVSRVKSWLGVIGLVAAVWSASGLFGAFRAALDVVWDVDRPLPPVRGKVHDVLLLAGSGGLLGAATMSTGLLQGARQAGADWLGPLLDLAEPVFALLAFLAPLAVTFAAFLVLYRFAPHARLTWADVWPAALLAALFFEFGKNLLSYYMRSLGAFNLLAGALGAGILVLAFVYYTAQVILFAAEAAKHRMLVRAGSVPATDPKVEKPNPPLGKKLKRTLAGLWEAKRMHHDPKLPYEPSRMDPETSRPANTREEVLLRHEQARENGAGAGGGAPSDVEEGQGAAGSRSAGP